jgi:rhodanese-related sulfurtransferase
LIPYDELPSRMCELDASSEIVVFCRTGVRSQLAIKILREAGFQNLKNLNGGINAWAQQVDPKMFQY